MKKKKILLSLLCVGAVLGTASCKVKTETPAPTPTTPEVVPTTPETNPTTPEVGPTTPETNPATPTPTPTPVVTTYKATLVYNNGVENGSITSVEDGGKYYFDKPSDPTKQYHKFVGWYTDEALTQPFNFNSEVSADITLYAKFVAAYDTVNTIWDLQAGAELIKAEPSGNVVVPGEGAVTYQNKFTVEANGKSRFEIGSKNAFNTQGTNIIVHLSAEGTNNGLTITYKWASSDSGKFTIKNIATGEIICEEANTSNEETKTFANLPAGDYEISGVINESKNASLRIYALAVTEQLPQGPTSGISVSASDAPVNFLKGRAFDTTGLNVVLDYENGRKDVLTSDKYTVSAVDMTTAGKKTVTITYQLNATTTYTDTYEVIVWEAKSLNVYDYTYNGTTNHARYVYFSDETEKSVDNITIKALCEAPEVEGTYEFKLNNNEYTVDKTNTNKIEFTYGDIDAEFNYVTIDKADLSAEEMIAVTVNPSAEVGVNNKIYNFHTIMQAMQFLNIAKASDDAKKIIVLSDGVTYKEKVEVTLPNIILTSDSAMNGSNTTEYPVIEYGLLAGDTEPGESRIYSTDGSATISIRKTAENFISQCVSFVNSYNTYAEYQVAKGLTSDTQGVAALVQADKAMFGWCSFSGYQDTLYAQVGRQYYQECYIEGHTDFIFGYDATAYFTDCTIKSIGAGADQNNGGYIVATKGNTTSSIEYGYVFDDCTFTADENTMAGSISLARGWDKDMTMAVINSEISGHYSKEAYGYATPDNPATEDIDESKKNLNDRYGKMNAAPVASKLVEYNNTGDGAITASIADTCTVLTAEQAAEYTLENIFTAYNGGTKYASSWVPFGERAQIHLKNSDGSEFLTVDSFGYIGTAATKAEYEALITEDNTPDGKLFAGFYADKECTTPYDPNKVLTAENVIYVKWDALAATKSISATFTSEDGTKAVYSVEGWTFSFSGSNSIGFDIGQPSSSSTLAKCPKFSAEGHSLTSATFDNATNNVKVEIIGASTGSDKAIEVKVEALDSEGNVVNTITMLTTLNKTTGYFTYEGKDFGVLTSTSKNISSIRISYVTGQKHFSVKTVNITYDVL